MLREGLERSSGERVRANLSDLDIRGVSRGRRGSRGGRVSAAAAALGGGDPAGSGPAPTGTEQADQRPPGIGPGRDPLRCLRGPDPGNADRDPGAQRGCPAVRLPGHQGPVSPLPCGLHHRGQVRNPQLAGWGTRQRPGDGGARRRRRHRTAAAAAGGEAWRCWAGSGRSTSSTRRSTPAP